MRSVFFCLAFILFAGGLFSLTAPAHAQRNSVECIATARLDACLADASLQAECSGSCAATCLALTSSEAQENPSLCGKCVALSTMMGGNPISSSIGATISTVVAATCVSAEAKNQIELAHMAVCTKGPRGCCIETVSNATPNTAAITETGSLDAIGEAASQAAQVASSGAGTGKVEKEDCKANGGVVYYADCFCEKNGTVLPVKPGQSLNACIEYCEERDATIVESRGIGAAGRLAESQGLNRSELQAVNALCFTREECAAPEYGGTSDAWLPGEGCLGGKGKCRAPEATLALSSPILGQTEVRGLRSFVELAFRFLLAIVVLAAAVAFIWGGFKYTFGSATGDISSAKSTMTNAVIGLILSFGAVTILNTINPATTRYDKLDVFLINKTEFSQNEYCDEYTKTDLKKPVMYGDAGTPPGSVLYDVAKFEKKVEQTLCGVEYYVQGFGGKTCKGKICEGQGDICLQCKSGIAECFGNKQGATCVSVALAGDIRYADGVRPERVYLVPFCNFMQVADNSFDTFQSHMGPDIVELEVTDNFVDAVSYRKVQNPSIYQKFEAGCADHGGLRGAMLGVVYKDTTAVIGGLSDYAIIAKSQCNGSGAKFVGYSDGAVLAGTVPLKTAMFCGYQTQSSNFHDGAGMFFTPSELKEAFTGSGKSVSCNTYMDSKNAPADPRQKLMPTCTGP